MATQREIDSMSRYEAQHLINEILREINAALNLDGADGDALEGLRDAVTIDEVDHALDSLGTPSCHCRKGTCDHDFPAWFVAQARPVLARYRRTWLQISRSPA
jgi:hypothetical protein